METTAQPSARAHDPLVSVVIPCYNQARFLPDSVSSCLRQSFANFEIIIVNDGSTDNTQEVAESLARKYPDKISVINQPNSGTSTTRNNGIRIARGQYILPLDADDIICPRFLEKTIAALKSNPKASLAYTWTRIFGTERGLCKNGEFSRVNLLIRNGPSCSMLFVKTAWERVGGYNPIMSRGGEDWEFTCSLFEAGYKGVVLPEPLLLYRKHGASRLAGEMSDSLRVVRDIKLLHPLLFEPGLSSISLRIARAVIWLKYYTRDRLSHFLYVRFPALHKTLAAIKYGTKAND